MTFDQIPDASYRPKGEPDRPEVRARYWNTAFGLQAADGLEPSPYARSLAQSNINGEVDLTRVGELLQAHYRCIDSQGPQACDGSSGRTREADLVSRRIVEVLEEGGFVLDPALLSSIHARLFQDLDPATYRPGHYKTEQLIKPEVVLNGDSVFYAPPSMYTGMLNALFAREAAYGYGYEFNAADCSNFSTFISRVWQVHPFVEGNTRTVAVFAELYLAELGFEVGNGPFEDHAAYFRDALVRANYRNRAVGVEFEPSFIEGFFAGLVHGSSSDFDRRELLCRPMFEHPEALRNAMAADAQEVRAYLAQMDRGLWDVSETASDERSS